MTPNNYYIVLSSMDFSRFVGHTRLEEAEAEAARLAAKERTAFYVMAATSVAQAPQVQITPQPVRSYRVYKMEQDYKAAGEDRAPNATETSNDHQS